jgi:hypothetical protein
MTSHNVLGREIGMPVEIRSASAFTASYAVSARAAQALIDYSGLKVLRIGPGRAMCTVVFVTYIDGDLGPYNEFGVCFLVRGRGVFIHRLPVDGEFTMAAGREIWGFPKELADFEVDGTHGVIRQHGQLIVDLQVKPGLKLPSPNAALDAYSHLEGVTRQTTWQMNPAGVRSRVGGATLSLGDHPWAQELSALGLPKRALLTSVIPQLQMTFHEPQQL